MLGGPLAKIPALNAGDNNLEQEGGTGLLRSGLMWELQIDSGNSEVPEMFITFLFITYTLMYL